MHSKRAEERLASEMEMNEECVHLSVELARSIFACRISTQYYRHAIQRCTVHVQYAHFARVAGISINFPAKRM